MKTKHKARTARTKPNSPFHYELQAWFLAEHLVDAPQVIAK